MNTDKITERVLKELDKETDKELIAYLKLQFGLIVKGLLEERRTRLIEQYAGQIISNDLGRIDDVRKREIVADAINLTDAVIAATSEEKKSNE